MKWLKVPKDGMLAAYVCVYAAMLWCDAVCTWLNMYTSSIHVIDRLNANASDCENCEERKKFKPEVSGRQPGYLYTKASEPQSLSSALESQNISKFLLSQTSSLAQCFTTTLFMTRKSRKGAKMTRVPGDGGRIDTRVPGLSFAKPQKFTLNVLDRTPIVDRSFGFL